MGEVNLRAVERIYEAWGRGDFASPADLFHDDIELVVRPGLPDPGAWYGRSDLAAFTRYFLTSWSELRLVPGKLEIHGDRVLVAIHQVGRGRVSDAETDLRYWQVWTLRDDRPARLEIILDEAEARAAAGNGRPE